MSENGNTDMDIVDNGAAPTGLGAEAARYTVAEEVANSLTHGLGLLLGIASLVMLVVFAARFATPTAVVAASIYGATIIVLYGTSMLYHALPKGSAKRVFEVLDHSAIFLLIAGTYTPYALLKVPGAWGWSIFGVIWGLAVLGITLEAVLRSRGRNLQLGLYLVMGWLVLIVIKPLIAAMPTGGMVLLAAGGVFYTLGVVFYMWHSLRFHHAIWHVLVLAGSLCHIFSVLLYVVGPYAAV